MCFCWKSYNVCLWKMNWISIRENSSLSIFLKMNVMVECKFLVIYLHTESIVPKNKRHVFCKKEKGICNIREHSRTFTSSQNGRSRRKYFLSHKIMNVWVALRIYSLLYTTIIIKYLNYYICVIILIQNLNSK